MPTVPGNLPLENGDSRASGARGVSPLYGATATQKPERSFGWASQSAHTLFPEKSIEVRHSENIGWFSQKAMMAISINRFRINFYIHKVVYLAHSHI